MIYHQMQPTFLIQGNNMLSYFFAITFVLLGSVLSLNRVKTTQSSDTRLVEHTTYLKENTIICREAEIFRKA